LKKKKDTMSSKDKKGSGEIAELQEDIADDGIEVTKAETPSEEEGKSAEGSDGSSVKDSSTEEVERLQQMEQQLQEQQEMLEEKSALVAEYEDLLKRKQADFENYRKRVQKESQDVKKYANAEIVLDVLSMMDDFERAIESTESSKDFDALHEGILLVEKQIRNTLESKYNVKAIDAVGKPFDPTVHDAIMMEESDTHDEDTVVEDFQKGYVMHDRVIRPAKVKVAKSVSPVGNESNEEEQQAE
jgi:molecular chaperone GrpE